MLATTCYEDPDAGYTFSIARSREVLHNAGFPTSYLLLTGNCHVDDARNTVVRDFLMSDCEDLIFLDADVSWQPEHLVKLCQYDCDVVGGVYPYRRDAGRGGMPVRNIKGVFRPDENGLLEVEGLPTGFLRIRRHVLETMIRYVPRFWKDNSDGVPLLFERRLVGDQRWGGDISFCARWRDLGGKVYAAAELILGHCGKHVVKDSLAASMRRQTGLTLSHVAEKIRESRETRDDLSEAVRAVNNPWGAREDILNLAILAARKATGPIIETGSGLTTVLMAAATGQKVWCLEHSSHFVGLLENMAHSAGVENIAIVHTPIKDGWYDLTEDRKLMPDAFSVGLVDGPPRVLGNRMKFFETFGDTTTVIICDDADDLDYFSELSSWAKLRSREIKTDGTRSAMIMGRTVSEAA
jgi:predicted O-methyltransferase YrrM